MKPCHRLYLTLFLLTLFLATATLGCSGNKFEGQIRSFNENNVSKVQTCFEIFASRNAGHGPESKEALVAFLTDPKFEKKLAMIDIDPNNVESVFSSERDGEPLKIRWGTEMNPDRPMPIAFESVGVNGIRLVAADLLLEVDNDEEYEDLWAGKYVSELDMMQRNSEEY